MSNQRILITGASGFLGMHAVEAFSNAGWEVIAHGRKASQLKASQLKGSTCVTSDLLDPAAASDLIASTKPTHLLHLAWRPVYGDIYNSRENFEWAKASERLAYEFWRQGGHRLIGGGTCIEYAPSEEALPEEYSTEVPNTYGSSKAALGRSLQKMSEDMGGSFVWGRVFFAYGPGEFKDRLSSSVIRSILRGEPAKTSHGEQLRDFIYVGDVADAFVTLANSEAQGIVNIGTGRAHSIKEMVQAIATHLGRPDLLHVGALPARPGEPALILADTKRLQEIFNYSAPTQLIDGIAKTIEWHACEQALVEPALRTKRHQ